MSNENGHAILCEDDIAQALKCPDCRAALIRAGWVAPSPPGAVVLRRRPFDADDPAIIAALVALVALGWTPPVVKESLRTGKDGLQVEPSMSAINCLIASMSRSESLSRATQNDPVELQCHVTAAGIADWITDLTKIKSDLASLEALRGAVRELISSLESGRPIGSESFKVGWRAAARKATSELRSLPGIGGKGGV